MMSEQYRTRRQNTTVLRDASGQGGRVSPSEQQTHLAASARQSGS
jgi:hypothetical protein